MNQNDAAAVLDALPRYEFTSHEGEFLQLADVEKALAAHVADGRDGGLDTLRERIKEMQNNLETVGQYSEEAVRIALDGVVDEIDEIKAERAAIQPAVEANTGLRNQMAYIAAYSLDELAGMTKDQLLGRCRVIIERAQNSIATPITHASTGVGDVTYWLVESTNGCGWWDGRFLSRGIDPRFFSHDPSEAVRFARKEDAERVCVQSSAIKATEHIWIAAPISEASASAGVGGGRYAVLQEVHAAISARRDVQGADLHEGMNKAINTVERLMLVAAPFAIQEAKAEQAEKCGLRLCCRADVHSAECNTYDLSRYPDDNALVESNVAVVIQAMMDAPANIAKRADTTPKGNMLGEFPACKPASHTPEHIERVLAKGEAGELPIKSWVVRYAENRDFGSMDDKEKRTRCMLNEIADLRAALARTAPASATRAPSDAEAIGMPDMSDDMLTPEQMKRHVQERMAERNNNPSLEEDPQLYACDFLLNAAQEFWESCHLVGQYGAVQWVSGTDGALLIYTRGEYREQLMRNIHMLPNQKQRDVEPSPTRDAEFKNFHRSLCARFGYVHDERDWKRDQVSLEEHIATLVAPTAPAPRGSIADDARFHDVLGRYNLGIACKDSLIEVIDTIIKGGGNA